MSMTIFVKMSTRNKSETICVQKTDEFLRIFEALAGRVGIELQHIRLTFSGKEYRHDQPEARKRVEDIGIKDRSTLFMVSRLPGGTDHYDTLS